MKKFLTVLLALSVVFTYSFSAMGSVFAVEKTEYTPNEFEAALEDVVDGYEDTLKGNIKRVKALYDYDDEGFTEIDGVKVSEEAVSEGIDAFIKELVDAMDKVIEDTLAADPTKEKYSKDDIENTTEKIANVIGKYGYEAAKNDYVKVDVEYPDSVKNYYILKDDKYVKATGYAEEGVSYNNIDRISAADVASTQFWVAVEDPEVADQFVRIEKPVTVVPNVIYYTIIQASPKLGEDISDKGYFELNGGKYEITADTRAIAEKTYYEYKTIDEGNPGTDLTKVADFAEALEKTAYIVKAEAPKAEKYYTAKVNEFDEANYTDNKEVFEGIVAGEKLTAQEAVAYYKEVALDAIEDAKDALAKIKEPTKDNYETAIKAYVGAYEAAKKAIDKIDTNEDIAEQETENAIDVDSAVAQLRSYAVGAYYDSMKIAAEDSVVAWDVFGEDIYVAAKTGNSATIFGIKVADVTEVTASEARTLNSALYAAIKDAVNVAEITLAGVKQGAYDSYPEALQAKLVELGLNDNTKFSGVVTNAYAIADVYQEVVDYGAKLKNTYKFGVKTYDDEKVDAVVAAAKELVYADLGSAAKDADKYFEAAIKVVYGATATLGDLKLDNSNALAAFKKAQTDAKDKFDKAIIKYGEDKTPEADLKYKKDTYVASAVTADDETWKDIRDEAVEAIDAAQSYADIDAALAAAEAKLAQLLTKENEDVIKNLRASYATSLDAYKLEKTAFLDMDKYDADDFAVAVEKGKELISKAGTEATLEDAFEKAKALVDAVKTIEALEAEEEALEEMLKALPLASKVTLEDKAAIEAARAAYDAYAEIPGAPAVAETKLVAAETKLADLEQAALEEEIEAMEKAIRAIGTVSDDKAAEAAVALKAEAEALKAKMDAHNEHIEELGLADIYKVDSSQLDNFLAKTGNTSAYYAEIYLVIKAIDAIGDKVENADPNAVKEAKKMFDALTDKQQYLVDNAGYADKLAAAVANIGMQVKALKITASSKAAKGSMTINWKVEGMASAADGFRIYKSTKKNSGFGTKPYFQTKDNTKRSYKNTKELKKGTRYYYKLRAYVVIDGKTYFSDYSNKAYRVAK